MDSRPFDIPTAVINANEPLVAIVQAHLHLEGFLVALIQQQLRHPDALDLDRLTFPNKLGLAVAMGTVPRVASPALLTINKLRNRIAHNLGGQIDQSDAAALAGQMAFVGSAMPAPDDPRPVHNRIAFMGAILQAWLNGVVEAGKIPADARTPEAAQKMAEERYSLDQPHSRTTPGA